MSARLIRGSAMRTFFFFFVCVIFLAAEDKLYPFFSDLEFLFFFCTRFTKVVWVAPAVVISPRQFGRAVSFHLALFRSETCRLSIHVSTIPKKSARLLIRRSLIATEHFAAFFPSSFVVADGDTSLRSIRSIAINGKLKTERKSREYVVGVLVFAWSSQ